MKICSQCTFFENEVKNIIGKLEPFSIDKELQLKGLHSVYKVKKIYNYIFTIFIYTINKLFQAYKRANNNL